MNPLTPGTLTFESPAGTLSPDMTCREFDGASLGQAASLRLEGMRTHFRLDCCTIAGEDFTADIVFEGQRLDRLELALRLAGDEEGWGGWTEEKERQRKERGERWLNHVCSKPSGILLFDTEGQWITPVERTWDATCGIRFPWGEITSYYDSKAAFVGILFRYGA